MKAILNVHFATVKINFHKNFQETFERKKIFLVLIRGVGIRLC